MGTISQKLTYLNDTKQLLKENINNLGGNLTNEPFRQYASVLEGIYESLPKVSGIGSSLSLSPSLMGKIKLNEIQGDTLQNGSPTPDNPIEIENVTGLQNVNVANATNIFDMKKYASENSNYFTYSIETGLTAILKDNRATVNVGFPIEVSPNTTYYVKTDTDKRLLVAQYNSNDGWIVNNEVFNGNSFTTNSNTSYLKIKVADTLTTFPTVVGNVYISTSNDYKGNTYEVNLGKNLLPFTNQDFTLKGIRYYVEDGNLYFDGTSQGETYSNNQQFKDNFSFYLEAGTYTFSQKSNNATTKYIDNFDTGTHIANINLGNKVKTFTLNEKTKVCLGFYVYNQTNDNELIEIQLEKGSQVTSYSPYFTPIELNKIGDYQDRIYKDNGKWYVEKKIGKVVLNGSEAYTSGSTNTSGVYRIRTTAIASLIKTPSSAGVNGNALSNYFGITTANQNYQCVQGFGIETSGALVFYDSGGNTQTTSAFTTWLSTHNTEVIYQLATPEITEITNEELINQLEALNTAKSQEGTTNISITSEDLEMILNVSALKGEE